MNITFLYIILHCIFILITQNIIVGLSFMGIFLCLKFAVKYVAYISKYLYIILNVKFQNATVLYVKEPVIQIIAFKM